MRDHNHTPLSPPCGDPAINSAAKAAMAAAQMANRRRRLAAGLNIAGHAALKENGRIDIYAAPAASFDSVVHLTVTYDPGDDRAFLEGCFSIDELQEIAAYMKQFPVIRSVGERLVRVQGERYVPCVVKAARREIVLRRLQTGPAVQDLALAPELNDELRNMMDEGLVETCEHPSETDWVGEPADALRLTDAGRRLCSELLGAQEAR
jgi:hypothetical protein